MGALILDWKLITDFSIGKDDRRKYIDTVMESHGFTLLGEGRMRRTYLSPNKKYVLKFPMTRDGIEGNISEHDIWHQNKHAANNHEINYAPCRLIRKTILMMWSCYEAFGESFGCEDALKKGALIKCSLDYPAWSTTVDCRQVGILKNGKFAAYDYTLY